MPHRIRLAHILLEYGIWPVAGMSGDMATLLRGLPDDAYEQEVYTNQELSTETAQTFEQTYGCRVRHGLKRWDQLASNLSGADVACVWHCYGSHLGFSAAEAAGVPVIVEKLEYPAAGRQYDAISVTICISKVVLALQPDPTRTVLIYNGIDLARFGCDRPLPRGRDLTLVQVGKPYDVDVDSMRSVIDILRNSGVPCVGWIIGSDGSSDDGIKYWGWRNDVDLLLRRADVLLHFCPRDEAFGLQVAEAMAAGVIPVVARAEGARSGPAEQVEEGISGLYFNPENPAEAAEVIRRIWNDVVHHEGVTTKVMQESARNRARLFSSERMVREHDVIFRRMLANTARRPPVPDSIEPAKNIFHESMHEFILGRRHLFLAGMRALIGHPDAKTDPTGWDRFFSKQLERPSLSSQSREDFRALRNWGRIFFAAHARGDVSRCWSLYLHLLLMMDGSGAVGPLAELLASMGGNPGNTGALLEAARSQVLCWRAT